MRRKDKAIVDPDEMASIIDRAVYCHLAMSDDGQPYCVPLCFGYRDGIVYLHCAAEGKKLAVIAKNPKVCMTFVGSASPKEGASPCSATMLYESVVGLGEAVVVVDPQEKREALNLIAARYDRNRQGTAEFPDAQLSVATVIRVQLIAMTGKRSR